MNKMYKVIAIRDNRIIDFWFYRGEKSTMEIKAEEMNKEIDDLGCNKNYKYIVVEE